MRRIARICFQTALMFFALNSIVEAQDLLGNRDRADKLFDEYQYAKAVPIYLKMTDTKTPKLKDMERLAECYRKMNKYEDAEIWYARVVKDPLSSPENLIKYGEILKANSYYAKAKQMLLSYAKKTGNKERVAVAIAGCDSAQVWLSNPTRHKLRNEISVNTPNSEFSAVPVGNSVFYTCEPVGDPFGKKYGWTGNSFLRIYNATRLNDNTLANPVISNNDFNKDIYHVGPLFASRNGDVLLITRTYPGKVVAAKGVGRDTYGTNKMELYIQTSDSGKWKAPVPFPFNNAKEYSIGHATLSRDGKIMYFASDMPGGLGGADIWYSIKNDDGTWGACFNLGYPINTPYDELFPIIGADGALYYSSNGLPGMGGLDIFKSKGSKDQWSKPVNMEYPVNSAGDDFSYVLNEDKASGYLSSNRKNGMGSDDIYSFTFPRSKNVHYLKGVVYDKQTRRSIPMADVVLTADMNVAAQQQSKADGSFTFQLEEETQYNVLASKSSFYSDSLNVRVKQTETSDTMNVALFLEPLFEKGKTIRIENILYDFDKDNIRPDAAIILDKLVKTMHENPTLKIELASHTDSRGSAVYNQNLSQRRAQSAVNYIVTRGISRDRMIAHGYGESKLQNNCADGVDCSDEQHQANRRTEFTVLGY